MDLSLQALPVVPWQQERGTWMGRMRCSSSQLHLLARRPQLARCSATEAEGDLSQEKQVYKEESARTEPAKSVDSGSWVQDKGKNTDPYLGWTSDGSQQSHSNNALGWVKIGGVAVLAIGFALGARSMYTKRDMAKEFAVSPPATEEAVPTSSKTAKTIGMEDHESAIENSESNSIAGDSLKEEKELIGDKVESDVQCRDESTPDQISIPNEQTESYREHEVSYKDPSATGTMPISENVEPEGNLETSAINEGFLSPAEDAEEKRSDATGLESPVVMGAKEKGSDATSTTNVKEEAAQDASEPADSTDENDDLDVDFSPSAFTSVQENDAEHVFKEPVMVNTRSEELANDGDDLLEDATSLPKHTLDKSSLHSSNTLEGLQGAAVDLDILGSLANENHVESMRIQHDEWGQGRFNSDLSGSRAELNMRFLSATITAPSTPPDSLPDSLGKVVVPAPVDHMQEQIMAALQALKVIEADVKPGDICTRREYARWLMKASAILTRSPAHKVLPAMYIENTSVLAYEDVVPEDGDFPFIQGLAEAGLLSSRLLGDDEDDDFLFAPDSPLTRQDLVTWKVALERKPAVLDETPFPDKTETLKKNLGFIDADKIHKDAWPALLVDIKAGEQSIIALAFGHTRRLQPQKPVSKAQAAVALATGEAWELVSEELARLEAESVAEAAVVAELALETRAQQEVAAAFQELLQVEREKYQEAASLAESTQAELEQIKADRENEKYSLLKERAALDSQKEFLSSARLEVEEQALVLSNAKLEVAFQREQADKLRAEAAEEKALISKARSELEIEKNALILARSWAEDEARKAQAHSKILEEARNKWESQGVQVNVEKELETVDENVNSFTPSSQYSESLQDQTSPMDGLVKKSKDVRQMFIDAFIRFLHFIQLIFQAIKERATDVFGRVGVKFHEARIACADSTTKTVEGLKRTVPASVAGITTNIREGTLKAVDEWKGGAEKLSQKFKTP